jgi:hypothetical protein
MLTGKSCTEVCITIRQLQLVTAYRVSPTVDTPVLSITSRGPASYSLRAYPIAAPVWLVPMLVGQAISSDEPGGQQ